MKAKAEFDSIKEYMKNRISILLIFLLSSNFDCSATKHVIGYQLYTGLYYNFLGVVNNLIWCKNNNKTPVVYWGLIACIMNPMVIGKNQMYGNITFKPIFTELRSQF